MAKLVWVSVCVVVAACGSSEPPNCESAIRSAAGRLSGSDKPSESELASAVSTCINDRWTGAVRSCVAGAGTPAALKSCISGREVAGDEPRRSGTRTEAELNLNAIQKSSQREYAENAAFYRGSVGLTPARSCCEFPGKKCEVTQSDWVGVPVWDALDFEQTRSHFFQYAYESDGQTLEARAVGDLDCDGATVTYVLRGRVENGSPVFEVTKPRNAD